jgi:flagellar FliL protein
MEQGKEEQKQNVPWNSPRQKMIFLVVSAVCLVLGFGAGFELANNKDRVRYQSKAANTAGYTYELPDLIANLDTGGRDPVHLRLAASLQLRGAADIGAIKQKMPRLIDELQTHLRALTPQEIQGAAGTQRMKAELLRRAARAVAPQHVDAVLIREMVVQ